MIQLNDISKGEMALPIPAGHLIKAPKGITVRYNADGDVRIQNKEDENSLIYVCCESVSQPPPSPENIIRLTQIPTPLPHPIPTPLDHLDFQMKKQWVRDQANSLVTYDTSSQTAASYRRQSENKNWLKKVLEIGRGDCDVINGLVVLLFRSLNVPARLAIGLSGQEGTIRSQLHAWAEYYNDGKWQVMDISPVLFSSASRDSQPISRQRPSRYSLLAYFIVVIGGVVIFLITGYYFLHRQGDKEEIHVRQGRSDIIHHLGLLSARVAHTPGTFRDNLRLKNEKIIPTLKGNRISLHQATRLGEKGLLFKGSFSNPLASQISQKGSLVLKTDDPHFSTLINTLTNVTDLDLLQQLNLNRNTALMDLMNKLLEESFPFRIQCFVAGSPMGTPGEIFHLPQGSPPFEGMVMVINSNDPNLLEPNNSLKLHRLASTILEKLNLNPVMEAEIKEKIGLFILKNA